MAGKEWDNVCMQVDTCALTGAAAFFAGIPDAAIVVNGPLWCYFYARRYLEKPCPNIGRCFYSTQPDNNAVVYGTEEYLLEVLHFIKRSLKPSVLLIENSCAISLIGDDIAGIVSQADLPCPVVCIDSGGLKGGFWEGYRAAVKAYFEVVPLKKRGLIQPHTVNLLGLTVGYYNAENDLRELKRMLALAGYEVLACPGAGSNTAEMTMMTQAEINIVIHEELGHELAEYLKQQYGIPYLSLLPPYGIEGSLNWLEKIRQALCMGEQSLQVIQREVNGIEAQLCAQLREAELIWGEPYFERTLIAAPSSVALSIAQALRLEWADIGTLAVVLHDGRLPHPAPCGIDDILDGQCDDIDIGHRLSGLAGGLLLASSQEKAILQQKVVPNVLCQNIALPVYDEIIISDRPFMGLRGSCHMIERLWNQYIQRWEVK